MMAASVRHLALWAALRAAACAAPGPRPPGEPPLPVAAHAPGDEALAAPDPHFDRLFTRSGGGWTGGDGTYSVLLPDGRTVWLFGDTFLGRVYPDRTRPQDAPLIHNCAVLQENGSLKTLHGGTADSPAALAAPQDGAGWYWPADGTVEQERLRLFLRRFRSTGPGPWQFAWEGTDVAAFSLPGMTLESIGALQWPNGVMYGSSILETPGGVYVYGTEDRGRRKYAHLARAKAGHLAGRWEFFDGAAWSPDPGRSARLLEGVANQFSVLVVKGRYLLLTMDNRTPFSNALVAYLAQEPQGPWQGPVTIYRAPEATAQIAAYNAFAHPQFTDGGGLLVSYNLNSVSDFSLPYADADAYRPRFIRVDLDRLLAVFGGMTEDR